MHACTFGWRKKKKKLLYKGGKNITGTKHAWGTGKTWVACIHGLRHTAVVGADSADWVFIFYLVPSDTRHAIAPAAGGPKPTDGGGLSL